MINKKEYVMTEHDITNEDFSVRSSEQIKEMLGEDNRNFFRNQHGREPIDDNELAFHYIKNGGAFDFDKRNRR